MAIDPAMPADLYADLRDIKARLSKMERLSQLGQTSIDAGTLTLRDSDGNVRVSIGDVDFSASVNDGTTNVAGGYGIAMFDENGALLWGSFAGTRGRVYPSEQIPMHRPVAVSVTDSSFASIFEGTVQDPAGDVVKISGAVICPAGTTGEIRLSIAGTTHHTDALTIPGGTNAFYLFEWLHPVEVGIGGTQSATDKNGSLVLEARRTSGTGTLSVFPPQIAEFVSSWLVTTAATDGNPTLE